MSSEEDAIQVSSVLPLWNLAIPLPAVLMIVVALYVAILGMVLWSRYCLKDRCCQCDCLCCANICFDCDLCYEWAQMCDCHPPSLHWFLERLCPSPSCDWCDCACTCQPPECDSCNFLCFEIKLT